jgi:hypothetical protein
MNDFKLNNCTVNVDFESLIFQNLSKCDRKRLWANYKDSVLNEEG